MSNGNPRKRYHKWTPEAGYPSAPNLFYECMRCGESVASRPPDSTHCKCRNIMIDIDYGRLKVQDSTQVRLYDL